MPNAFSAASKARVIAARSSDVGLDGDRLPALAFDLGLQRLERVSPPRHQRDRSAIVGQRLANCVPSPLDAPVTSATRPFRLNISAAFMQ